jgi:hypothetical protein
MTVSQRNVVEWFDDDRRFHEPRARTEIGILDETINDRAARSDISTKDQIHFLCNVECIERKMDCPPEQGLSLSGSLMPLLRFC